MKIKLPDRLSKWDIAALSIASVLSLMFITLVAFFLLNPLAAFSPAFNIAIAVATIAGLILFALAKKKAVRKALRIFLLISILLCTFGIAFAFIAIIALALML